MGKISDDWRSVAARFSDDGEVAIAAAFTACADRLDRDGIEFRLDHLNAWLESRGLPRDWTGPLDAWGWVGLRTGGKVPTVMYYSIGTSWHSESPDACNGRYFHWSRWDCATPEQRAEALQIEAERTSRTNDTERT